MKQSKTEDSFFAARSIAIQLATGSPRAVAASPKAGASLALVSPVGDGDQSDEDECAASTQRSPWRKLPKGSASRSAFPHYCRLVIWNPNYRGVYANGTDKLDFTACKDTEFLTLALGTSSQFQEHHFVLL